MASLFDRILRVLTRTARDVVTDVAREELEKRTGGSHGSKGSAGGHSSSGTRGSNGSSRSTTTRDTGATPAAGSQDTSVYDVAALGLPSFSYAPDPDGEADPGEVVWTWVPYEEDATKGKDRPVLVLARHDGRLVIAQLTSKDHDRDAAQEARWGRYWHDVGTGAWDLQGRPSEMRLDRLLLVSPSAVRREGATMERAAFDDAVAALREHWT